MSNSFRQFIKRLGQVSGQVSLCEAIGEAFDATHGNNLPEMFKNISYYIEDAEIDIGGEEGTVYVGIGPIDGPETIEVNGETLYTEELSVVLSLDLITERESNEATYVPYGSTMACYDEGGDYIIAYPELDIKNSKFNVSGDDVSREDIMRTLGITADDCDAVIRAVYDMAYDDIEKVVDKEAEYYNSSY